MIVFDGCTDGCIDGVALLIYMMVVMMMLWWEILDGDYVDDDKLMMTTARWLNDWINIGWMIG